MGITKRLAPLLLIIVRALCAQTSPCDVNADGSSNAIDLQLVINQALGLAPCTADLNHDGKCDIVDVQRIIGAALGGLCTTGSTSGGTTLEVFGGYPDLAVPGGPKCPDPAHSSSCVFDVRKMGNHWVLVTPAGNAFWMRGVFAIISSDGDSASRRIYTSSDTFKTRYNNRSHDFSNAALRRIKAWGFNTVSGYSHSATFPVQANFDVELPDSDAREPFIRFLNVPYYASFPDSHAGTCTEVDAASCIPSWRLAPSAAKTLIAGAVNPMYYRSGWPGHLVDPFDPNFEIFAKYLTADVRMTSDDGKVVYRSTTFTEKGNISVATPVDFTKNPPNPHKSLGDVTTKSAPWLIGTQMGDSDFLFGFGPGPDIPGYSRKGIDGAVHPHIGWIVAVTKPTQTINTKIGQAFGTSKTVTYKDPTVYAKKAWRDFLAARYGTIDKLNSAWGSNYTTFDSDGGWGIGRGLLDEDGRNPWIGSNYDNPSATNARVGADMDAFLKIFAEKFFKVMHDAIKLATPNHLVIGPSMLNGHKGETRRPIIEAAAEYCDIIDINQDPARPDIFDDTYQWTGGKPMISWVGFQANPDSAMGYLGNMSNTVLTQALRAAKYTATVDILANRPMRDGVYPGVGLHWWQYQDNYRENGNWGLVTPAHDAYDGKESTVDPGLAGSYPIKYSGVTLPTSCEIGDFFFNTTEPLGSNLYLCSSARQWSRKTYASGSPTPSSACSLNDLYYQSASPSWALYYCVPLNKWVRRPVGESGNWGDFLTTVTNVNRSIRATLSR